MSGLIQIENDRFHDHCGVCGVFGHPEAAKMAYLGLYALQHRGQESAGIVLERRARTASRKSMGLVADIFQPEVLARLPGDAALGHTRYSTAGDTSLMNAQPIVIDCNKGKLALGHNGNLPSAAKWRRTLEHRGSIFQTTSDTEVIVHLVARSQARNLSGALADALNQVEGAYSLLVLTRDEMYALRDPRGFRPLALGQLDGAWIVASETCAFDLIGATYVRDVEPGEMLRITRTGIESLHFAPEKPLQHCIFEHVYFARPDSLVFGRVVEESREMLGRLLAREHPVPADIVVPVPDSGVPAAIGYSLESGVPFRMGLIRNHYVGRTFIEPQQAIRDFGVKLKLNPVRGMLEGKRVVLVDDSIVRGTTSRKIVRLVREAGATEVHMRISCPPTISPCYYGVDTPTREELIAADESRGRPRLTQEEIEAFEGKLDPRQRSVEEIRRYLGADSLGYLSLESLRRAVGDSAGTFCTSCYTGVYPVDGAQAELDPRAAVPKNRRWWKFRWCQMNGEETLPVAAEPKPALGKLVLREALSWLWVILAFLFITGTIVQARVIPSGSMEKTLLVGDHLLMSRFGYDAEVPMTQLHMRLWREPHRQQIVVFRAPLPGNPDYIKRLIGLPGDQLEVREGVVYINGKKLDEPYRAAPPNPVDNYGPVTVPKGEYFMMGDNRDDSYDSRYWGFVPHENIIGTPILVYMSIDAPGEAWDPGHIRDRMTTYASVFWHPSIVRWRRIFKVF